MGPWIDLKLLVKHQRIISSVGILISEAPAAFFSFSHILILQAASIRTAAPMAARPSLRKML